jgi:hypothetical protein
MTRFAALTAALALSLTASAHAEDAYLQKPNTLTPAEIAAGWRLLFDGSTTTGWRGYKQDAFPAKGWKVENGELTVLAGGGGGDIITADQFADFELSLEFKCAPKANSGIIYRVSEAKDYPWMTGPEFQILDDAGHPDGAHPKHTCGALYDLITPPDNKPAAPADQWNHARIMISDGVLRHWLNGVKVAEVRIDNDDWKTLIAGSKFKAWPGFGLEPRGHIALQDHGDTVSFRNIKIRDLDAPMPGEVRLFNGQDLSGWTAFVPDLGGATPEAAKVWEVRDGTLVCFGNPAGYIRTNDSFTSYVLKLQWRFDPAKGPGNSGVLLRLNGPDKVWPRSVEAQLHSGDAGDFWNIDEMRMTTDPARTRGRNTRKLVMAERPLGEWNEYEIIVDGPTVTLYVNGELCNQATDVEITPGPIALQSEGAEIHFRDIRLAPIESSHGR